MVFKNSRTFPFSLFVIFVYLGLVSLFFYSNQGLLWPLSIIIFIAKTISILLPAIIVLSMICREVIIGEQSIIIKYAFSVFDRKVLISDISKIQRFGYIFFKIETIDNRYFLLPKTIQSKTKLIICIKGPPENNPKKEFKSLAYRLITVVIMAYIVKQVTHINFYIAAAMLLVTLCYLPYKDRYMTKKAATCINIISIIDFIIMLLVLLLIETIKNSSR